MAFTVSPAWSLTFSVKDNNDNRGGVSFNLPSGLTLAAAQAAAEAIRTPLEALIDARVDAMLLSLVWYNDDDAPIPATSEVERKLAVTFSDVSGRYKSSIEVPSPKFDIEQVGTDVVDPAQALVAAFTGAVINTGLGEGNSPVTYGGLDITKVLGDIRVTHRERRKKD